MALRGTLTHRKTRRLAKILGIPVPCALGLMEALWHVTAEQQPDGAIGRMSNQDIADEMFWEEDADQLIEALIEAGVIDNNETHRIVIHDWHESADQSVHTFLAKRTMLFWNGERPRLSDTTLSGQTRNRIQSEYDAKHQKKSDSSQTVVVKSLTNPEPEPEPDPNTPQPPKGASPTRFRKPTQEEVKAYAESRGYPPTEASAFWDFYESKGWKVGRNPMKDWQAAWRNWERGKEKFSPNGKAPASEREYIQGVPNL